MNFLFALALTLVSITSENTVEWELAAMRIAGVSDLSDMDEDAMIQFRTLYEKKIHVNSCSLTALKSCGLFSKYQAESLVDYRMRNGDILSIDELSLVDGFVADYVVNLLPFVDFTQSSAIMDSRLDAELTTGLSYKHNDSGNKWQYLLKSTFEWKQFSANIASKSQWSSSLGWPSLPSWNVSYCGKKYLGRLTVGNFNARYAQGLIQWSGTRIKNDANPSALMMKPSGIVPYSSYSPDNALCGAAVALDIKRFSVSAYTDVKMILSPQCGANVSWNHKNGEIGMSGVVKFDSGKFSDYAFSADFQHMVNGLCLYAETAFSSSDLFSLLSGLRYQYGQFDLGLRMRYSKSLHEVCSAMVWMSQARTDVLQCSASLAYSSSGMKLKLISENTFQLSKSISLVSRLDMKMQAMLNLGLRQDVLWKSGSWSLKSRLEMRHCVFHAFAASMEGSYDNGTLFKSYLQVAAFCVDDWADRIYVYIHDTPSTFNVPALYGRGVMAASSFMCRFGRWGKLYLTASLFSYPWARPQDTHKKTSAEAKVQFCVIL